MSAVAFAGERVRVLRGTSREVADQIDNETVYFVDVDGDHTLRGITIDCLNIWKKVRAGWLSAQR
jgi:methyltransferase family protein